MLSKQERLEIYSKATQLWGETAQLDQWIEEMAELTVAINKYKRKVLYGEYEGNEKVVSNLIEEIADVRMCVEQMCDMFKRYDIDAELDRKMQKFKGQIKEMENRKNKEWFFNHSFSNCSTLTWLGTALIE